LVGGQPDRVFDPLSLQVLVDLGHREGGIGPEIDARDLAAITDDDRLEHPLPAVRAVHVAGTQRAAFQIAELVEHEQRMIAGASVMTVPDAHLLLPMGRADARIHVEHDATRRPSSVHQVDPVAREVGQSGEVRICRKPLRLETPHLAWRSRAGQRRLAAHDPTHRRIMTQPFGIVHVLVASETAKHRLPQQANQRMATILARARIGDHLACEHRQSKRVIELAIGQQSSIGGDDGTAKLQQQAAVKIEANSTGFRFTRWIRHRDLPQSQISSSSLYLNRGASCENRHVIRRMRA